MGDEGPTSRKGGLGSGQACQAQGPCSESLVLLHLRTGASKGPPNLALLGRTGVKGTGVLRIRIPTLLVPLPFPSSREAQLGESSFVTIT